MRAVVIGSGEIKDGNIIKKYCENSFVICCDGGMGYALKENIRPDVILGDMDSVRKDELEYYEKKGFEMKKYPREKDYTDMELGIDEALKTDAGEVILLGAAGSRLDHTIMNIQLLKKIAEKGKKAKLINDNNIISLIDSKIEISGKKGDIVSLIPFTEKVCGICTRGLEYSLNAYIMTMGHSIGISNVMKEEKAEITIKQGLLLVIQAWD
ncbi:MAG: thiamine diphosphokinase [Firmicutes bacterium]|nr:thiamine diphosphokinase [Bacillota bacterium]